MKDYLLDIQRSVDATPYGELSFTVRRGFSKTTGLDSVAVETLKYDNNKDALDGLLTILDRMITSGADHRLAFNIEIKKGMILLIGYQNTKTKLYG